MCTGGEARAFCASTTASQKRHSRPGWTRDTHSLHDGGRRCHHAEERLQDYEAHLTYLVNNGALSQAEAEDLFQRYAGLVFEETLAMIAGGDGLDYRLSPFYTGYPLYAVGGSPIPATGFTNRSVRIKTGDGYRRRFGGFSQRGFGRAAWHGSRGSSARWTRLGPGSRSSFRGASAGKGSSRRGGRR